jgi:hemin uptake protein HemP
LGRLRSYALVPPDRLLMGRHLHRRKFVASRIGDWSARQNLNLAAVPEFFRILKLLQKSATTECYFYLCWLLDNLALAPENNLHGQQTFPNAYRISRSLPNFGPNALLIIDHWDSIIGGRFHSFSSIQCLLCVREFWVGARSVDSIGKFWNSKKWKFWF